MDQDFFARGAKAAERDGAEARRDGWKKCPASGWSEAALAALRVELGKDDEPSDNDRDEFCRAYGYVMDALVD